MSKKKEHHEEHADETWLIPYSDMLTLLLALFIVMFAMSQVDKEKFEQISNQFNSVFSGGSGHFDKDGDRAVAPVKPYNSDSGTGESGNGKSNSAIEEDQMKEIKETLESEIKKEGYSDKIVLVLDKEGLDISIQDTVLFASGDATVLSNVTPVLKLLANKLAAIDNQIRVVGHTDNVPIKNSKFRSNWDLSAMRAINVMEFLKDTGGIPPNRFTIQGNGEYSPKFDNSTDSGRAKNRRVEIIIIRKYPDKSDDGKSNEKNKE